MGVGKGFEGIVWLYNVLVMPTGWAEAKPNKSLCDKEQKMDAKSKFVLYGFDGKPKQYYMVSSEVVNSTTASSKKDVKPGHSIIVVDRSGSMYGDIESVKDMLKKLLTLDEYNNSSMIVSLITYSTSGDCTVHFERVPVQEVMKADSKQQAEIKRIRANGLTCISQAMTLARELVRDGEPTAIVLHSDGYANDPGVWSEQRAVTAVCESMKGRNVFVNTVAYRDSSDFSFLSSVANSASGKCVKASSVKEVYDALHDSVASVNGAVVPPVEVKKGTSDYLVFVSNSKRRVNGGDSDMTIAGLSPDDDGTLYRYYLSSKSDYDRSPYPVLQHGSHILALARAKLADGRLNDAKFAAYSSCIGELAEHVKALTGTQLAEMARDIEAYLFDRSRLSKSHLQTETGKLPDKPKSLGGNVTVVGVLMALEAARDDIMLDIGNLQSNYKLRGVKRVPGVRGSSGIEKPWLEQEYTDAGDWVPMGSFEFNRNNATINMLISRPSRLVKVADRKPVSEISGINVASLPSFRYYTVVGDGEVVVPELRVKFGNKTAFDLLNKMGAICGGDCVWGKAAGEYDSKASYSIRLYELPVSSFDFTGDVSGMSVAFRDILGAKVVSGILSAITQDVSSKYTVEQLSELKRHYLSASLNINFPTTTEYADLDEALRTGVVDTRVSYKVDIGDRGILNSGWLYSANEFLARHFMIVGAPKAADKPKWSMFLNPKVSFQAKPPSSKMKLSEVDSFCKPIFEEFLGLATNGTVKAILKKAGVEKSVLDIVRGGVASMEEVEKALDGYIEASYRDKIMPFAFFVGSTGLLPDCFDAKGISADELEAKLPGLKLGKSERDGTFFMVGDMIISIYAKNEYFSTGKSA